MAFVGPRVITLKCLYAAALFGITALTQMAAMAQGRSARDYLNAPVDTWLTTANSVYSTSVTPEDGMDISSRIRTNVFSQTIIYPDYGFWRTQRRNIRHIPLCCRECEHGPERSLE